MNEIHEAGIHQTYARTGQPCQCEPCVKARYGGRWPTAEEAFAAMDAIQGSLPDTQKKAAAPSSGGVVFGSSGLRLVRRP